MWGGTVAMWRGTVAMWGGTVAMRGDTVAMWLELASPMLEVPIQDCARFLKTLFTQQVIGPQFSSELGKMEAVRKSSHTPPQLHRSRYKWASCVTAMAIG